jgi:hypothetical protein
VADCWVRFGDSVILTDVALSRNVVLYPRATAGKSMQIARTMIDHIPPDNRERQLARLLEASPALEPKTAACMKSARWCEAAAGRVRLSRP